MTSQFVGNCTYATMEALLNALTALDNLEKKIKGNTIGKADWYQAFAATHPVIAEWESFDKEMVFDEFVSEIEEWLADKGQFGKENLKTTYQEALIYWKVSPIAHQNPVQAKKVDSLLDALAKRP